jgi:hypothetical protein
LTNKKNGFGRERGGGDEKTKQKPKKERYHPIKA